MVDVDFTIIPRDWRGTRPHLELRRAWAENAPYTDETACVLVTGIRVAAVPPGPRDLQVVYNTRTRDGVVVEVLDCLLVSNGDGDEQDPFLRYLCVPAEWVEWEEVKRVAGDGGRFGDNLFQTEGFGS
jgi:hypothetical protein